jgi:hypothetical protein
MARPFKILYEYFALYCSLSLLGAAVPDLVGVRAAAVCSASGAARHRAGPLRGIMAGFRFYAWSLSVTRAYRLDMRDIDRCAAAHRRARAESSQPHRRAADPDAPPEHRLRHEIRTHEQCISRIRRAPGALCPQRLAAADDQGVGRAFAPRLRAAAVSRGHSHQALADQPH